MSDTEEVDQIEDEEEVVEVEVAPEAAPEEEVEEEEVEEEAEPEPEPEPEVVEEEEAYEEEGMCIQVLKVVCVLLIGQTALCQSPLPVQEVYGIARLEKETMSMSPCAPAAKYWPNLVSC
eukprot:XP_014039084.1 PREDICTED: procyclic form-specific polypeptide B-alpha-like isoform X2 [Salmo salar]